MRPWRILATGCRATGWPRGVAVALAALALAIRVMIPEGFMADDRAGAKGFGIVICTGQGPLSLAGPAHKDGAPDKSGHETPCAFAGHAAPPIPTWTALPVQARFEAVSLPVARLRDLAPGRGLAAPPPPSLGPPLPV